MEDQSESDDTNVYNNQNTTQNSFNTNHNSYSNGLHNKNYQQVNRDGAKNYNPYIKPMICDQLDEQSRFKLDKMVKDIEDNLETIKEEKEAYYRDMYESKSEMSKYDNSENAYLYSKDNM